MSKVGAVERANPLPAGVYWVDVFGANIPKFDSWLTTYSNLGVHVDATEHFGAASVPQVRNWYRFTVNPVPGLPVVWSTQFGFPTVADERIKTSADTVQRPDLPLDALDEAANWVNTLEQKLGGSLGTLAGFVPYAIIGLGLYAGYELVKDSIITARKVKRFGTRTR